MTVTNSEYQRWHCPFVR